MSAVNIYNRLYLCTDINDSPSHIFIQIIQLSMIRRFIVQFILFIHVLLMYII